LPCRPHPTATAGRFADPQCRGQWHPNRRPPRKRAYGHARRQGRASGGQGVTQPFEKAKNPPFRIGNGTGAVPYRPASRGGVVGEAMCEAEVKALLHAAGLTGSLTCERDLMGDGVNS
jgi:hypothetical protein